MRKPRHSQGIGQPMSHHSQGWGQRHRPHVELCAPNSSPASCQGRRDTACPVQINTTAAKVSGLCQPLPPSCAAGHGTDPGEQPSCRARRRNQKPVMDKWRQQGLLASSAAAPGHPAHLLHFIKGGESRTTSRHWLPWKLYPFCRC